MGLGKYINDAREKISGLGWAPTIGIGAVGAGLGAVGIGALLNSGNDSDPYRAGVLPYPVPPAVPQRGGGSGVNMPYNPQMMAGSITPLTAEEIARQIEYENRNANTSLMMLQQLTALQRQLEGQA